MDGMRGGGGGPVLLSLQQQTPSAHQVHLGSLTEGLSGMGWGGVLAFIFSF